MEGRWLNSFQRYQPIRASIPLQLWPNTLAARPLFRSIRPADRAALNTVGVASEGDIAHRADQGAQHLRKPTAAGIKIGVLSDSVDYLSKRSEFRRSVQRNGFAWPKW